MSRLLNRLANLFLLCLGIFSLLAIIAGSFQCRYDRSLWVWMLVLCALLWVASSFRRGFWIGMPVAAALLFLAYRFYGHNPMLQLQDLIDHISGAFYTHILHPGDSYPYLNAANSHSLILLFLGFLLAAYLSTALTSRSMRITLALLETVPIFTACAMVNGEMPAIASAGMLLFWFLLLVGGVGYNPEGNLGRTVLCCVLPIALLLGGLLVRFDPAKYEYTPRDQELAEHFEKLSRYFDLFTGKTKEQQAYTADPDQPSSTSAPRSQFKPSWDNNDSMQLETEFDAEHADLRLLQVRAQTSGRLYLRVQSFGDYTGTGWRPAEELSSGSSLPFTAFAAELSPQGVKRDLDIRSFLDLSALCIPYYAAVSSGSDVSVTAEDQSSYRVSYIDYKGSMDTLVLPAEAAAAEVKYRSHAHSVYTRLPEATRAAALHLCEDAGIRGDDPNLVQTIADYVSQSGEYDLQTGPYPSTDYAIYFLTESHHGYCIHYATAAAVLYRSFGIPARVTEGFAVETRGGFYTDVVAGDAHAWVEVYQDGLGWFPVEVTARGGLATSLPDATPSPSPMPEPEQQPSPSPDPASGMEENGGGGGGPGPSPTPEPDPVNEPGSGFPWWLLLILPALVLLFFLWYGLARARFISQTQHADGRRAVIACWRYARQAAAFGSEIPPVIQQKAEKVTFSPHTIQPEELEQCKTELQNLIDTVYPALDPIGKVRFRFFRGMK